MTFSRSAIQEFSTANKIYVNASVTFYTVVDGAKTTTKANLYASTTGTSKLSNPQTLDSYGKLRTPVYIDEPVIAVVSGLGNVPDHETGIIAGGSAALEAAASATAAAASAATATTKASEATASAATASAAQAQSSADALNTAADRVQTGLDVIASSASASAAAASAAQAAVSAADAAMVDTAGVALLTKRTDSFALQDTSPNLFSDVSFTRLIAGVGLGPKNETCIKDSNAVGTVTTVNGRKRCTVLSNNSSVGALNMDFTLSEFGIVAGTDKMVFACRVTGRTGTTLDNGTSIVIKQLNSGGTTIAGTQQNFQIPIATGNYPPEQYAYLVTPTLDAACVKLRVGFSSKNSSNGFTFEDVLVAAGDNPNFRPYILAPVAPLQSPLARRTEGAPDLVRNPNAFTDDTFALMASAGTTMSAADTWGATVIRDAVASVSAVTTANGRPALRVTSTSTNGAVYYLRPISGTGITNGAKFSAAVRIVARTGATVAGTAVTINQINSGGSSISGTSVSATIPTGPLDGEVVLAPSTWKGMTVHADCVKFRVAVQVVDSSQSMDVTDILVAPGENQDFRPFIGNLTTRADAAAIATTQADAEIAALVPAMVAAGVAGAAVAVAMRTPHTFAMMGDSRTVAAWYDSTSKRSFSAKSFFTNAFMHPDMGGRAWMIFNNAESGKRADEYCTQAKLNDAIASGAGWLALHGVVNDFAQGYTASQAWNGVNGSPGLKSAAQQALAAGMRVLFILEPGAENYSGNATKIGEIIKYNRYVREFAEANAYVYVFDMPKAMLDPTYAYPKYKANYSDDGIHPVLHGAYYGGLALKDMLIKAIPELSYETLGNWDIPVNGGVQMLTNALFTTTTGGTTNTGFTGNIPSGWAATRGGTPTCTVSTSANADGYGNDLVLDCVFNRSDDNITIKQTMNVADFAIGDILQAGVKVTVDSGSSNFGGATAMIFPTIDSVSQSNRAFSFEGVGIAPTVEHSQVQVGKSQILTGTTINSLTFEIRVVPGRMPGVAAASQSASGTVRISCPWMRKRNTV